MTALKSVEAHLADLATLLPLRAAVRAAALSAVGCVLVEDVVASTDLPSFASSAMDGYAVRVSDVPGELEVIAEVPAGRVPKVAVLAGTAIRIMTGSLLPSGTEAIVPVEDTRFEGGRLVVDAATTAGRFVRLAGSDVTAGQVIIRAGVRIGPAQIAALYAAGVLDPLVTPRPRVAVVATGDELVAGGTTPEGAELVDSNRPALLAAAAAAGADVVDGGLVRDDDRELIARLDELAPDADLIITSGGVSVGAYDVVKSALRDRDTVMFDRVAVQPGMPQAWGHYGAGGPAFLGLPGNPVSALVSFELFARQVLGRPRRRIRVSLGADIGGSPVDKLQLLRGRMVGNIVVPYGGSGSHLLVALAGANALIMVPSGVAELAAGSDVDVIALEDT